jgi:hypothetical protein
MRTGKRVSTRALMIFIVLIAIELALFEGVMQILVIPPVTIMVLAINLGLFFLVVRPPALERRIIGMLLGGVAAVFALLASILQELLVDFSRSRIGVVNDLKNFLVNWASSLPDQEGLTVSVLRFVSDHIVVIGFGLLDLLGVTMIWAGGWLESRWRRYRGRPRSPVSRPARPLDDNAVTPL